MNSESKEHPILFSAPIVNAILAGKKTMTRRIVSRANSLVDGHGASKAMWESLDFSKAWVDPGPSPSGNSGPYLKVPCPTNDSVHRVYSRKMKKDLLWCKETFCRKLWDEEHFWNDHEGRSCSDVRWVEEEPKAPGSTWYYADGDRPAVDMEGDEIRWTEKRPSIYMPRWASRITLEIEAVKPERLQDISEEDAKAEGVDASVSETWSGYDPKSDGYPEFFAPPPPEYGIENVRHHVNTITTAREMYARLWDEINGKKFPWDSNTFVWVVSFKRVCQCASAIEDPGPHLATCPYADDAYEAVRS